MLSCKEAARLLSESLEERLPFGRRLSLRFHVMMCHLCRRYGRQIKVLDKILRKYGEDTAEAEDLPGPALSPDANARLKAALQEEG